MAPFVAAGTSGTVLTLIEVTGTASHKAHTAQGNIVRLAQATTSLRLSRQTKPPAPSGGSGFHNMICDTRVYGWSGNAQSRALDRYWRGFGDEETQGREPEK